MKDLECSLSIDVSTTSEAQLVHGETG
ncbi:hypothetical protein V2J09_020653 [Rumex salicifolius]